MVLCLILLAQAFAQLFGLCSQLAYLLRDTLTSHCYQFIQACRCLRHGLVPGAAVTGYLRVPGEPVAGFTVPDSAIVRQASYGWVYVQISEQTFVRRQIALDHRTEHGWFVRAGVAVNDLIVVNGAQTLLSEEQKYQIRMLY